MSAPTATSHPYDHARRIPDDTSPRNVDWSDRLGEDLDGWQSAETVEHDDHLFVVGLFGHVYGAVVEGTYYSVVEVTRRAEDEDPIEPDEDGPWRQLADAFDVFEDHAHAEGPIYNEFYLLERGSYYSSRAFDLAAWAAKLDGLPLCAVELDGDYGIALTGAGMDLSWEIAEAHLRLGYRVPTWIDLPQMADDRMGVDYPDARPLTEKHAAIVRAVIRDRRAEAERHTRAADRLAERYGITEAQA